MVARSPLHCSRASALPESAQALSSAFVFETVSYTWHCADTILTELPQLSTRKYQNLWLKSLTRDISDLIHLPHFHAYNFGLGGVVLGTVLFKVLKSVFSFQFPTFLLYKGVKRQEGRWMVSLVIIYPE